MKIVHLCLCSFFIDGYSYQENLLPKHHALQGNNVTVIASTFSFNKEGKGCYVHSGTHYENGYKVVRIDYKSGFSLKINKVLKIYKDTLKILEQENPDIIFSHGIQYWDAFKVIKYLKKHPNVKLFADNHADYINSATNFISKWIKHKIIWKITSRLIYKHAIACYGVTPMRCEFLQSMYGLPNNKIKFLPMGIDDDSIPKNRQEIKSSVRKELNISAQSFVICTGGKLDYRKNTHHLLSSCKIINDQTIHVIIFGTATPEFEVELNKYVDNSNIHIVGWCEAKRVIEMMLASDLAVFPGTHSTLWEQSIGLGLPCIFKDWGEGFNHLNVNGNCLFINGEDDNEIAEMIKSLNFTKKYNKLRENALIASEKFLYSQIAKDSINIPNNTDNL